LRALFELAHRALPLVEQIGPMVVVGLVAIWLLVRTLRQVRRERAAACARLVVIGVPPTVDAKGALLLWSALHDLLRGHVARMLGGQPHLAWEIFAVETGTMFRLWVPPSIPAGLIERAISAAWPGASTTIELVRRDESASAGEAGLELASELVLSGPDWFSLNRGATPDPVPLILGQLSGLRDRQTGLVQVLVRPATRRDQRRLRTAARRVRAGVSASRPVRLFDLLTVRRPSRATVDPTISPDVRDVLEKSAQPLFRCMVRVAVRASSRAEAQGRLDAVIGGFAAYEGRVGLRRRRVRDARRRLQDRALDRRAFLASTGELAALAHLPAEPSIPGLVRASAREVSPPPGLSPHGKPLGVSAGKRVYLAVADARHHLHILGPTGVGKSTLVAQLVLADLAERRGAVVIDPKGDLVEDLLARVPEGREDDVELFDPAEPAPLTMNMLDNPDRDLGVDQLVAIFRKVFQADWGPRTDDILRATLLTLTSNGRSATLADVPRLLTDPAWQAELIAQIDDPVGLGPFWRWYQGLSEAQRSNSTGPLLNKLRVFLLRKSVRAIVSAPTTTLDIAGCLNEGRLLLARVAKGTIGEDASRLLGSMIVARAWQATLARAAVKPEERRDCSLYIDEVQNYLHLPTAIPDVLAEARGYRLSLCMAHQHIGQLTPELREGISANARTKVYFQLSQDDAHQLAPDVSPELSEYDLAHLPLYTAAVRVCRGGQTGQPFTLPTEPLSVTIPGRAEAVRRSLRQRAQAREEQAEAEAPQLEGQRRASAKPFRRHRRYQRPTDTADLTADLSADLPSDLPPD
jgi:hypothetical protein